MRKVTYEDIIQYNDLVARVERNGSKILELQVRDVPIVSGKVKGSSRHFPYIETHMTVQMEEPREADKIDKRIAALQTCIDNDQKKIDEIDMIYDSITDSELKTIFDMRVYEGKTWIDIAAELSDKKDRTTYAKKFKKFIENSHYSPISQ